MASKTLIQERNDGSVTTPLGKARRPLRGTLQRGLQPGLLTSLIVTELGILDLRTLGTEILLNIHEPTKMTAPVTDTLSKNLTNSCFARMCDVGACQVGG